MPDFAARTARQAGDTARGFGFRRLRPAPRIGTGNGGSSREQQAGETGKEGGFCFH